MLDEIARFNQECWEALAQAGVEYSCPFLDLNVETARVKVDPEGMLGSLSGCNVLCLAAGGGQQSAAFALLGADVTVLDLTETQLQRDRDAAEHYGTSVTTVQGDMRDLSRFEGDSFDVVWQAHSLNFVPEAQEVFAQVSSVLRPGGLYRLSCTNPFIHGTWEDTWDGNGYPLSRQYADGELLGEDPHWEFSDPTGVRQRVRGPREFRHTLSTLINGLIGAGFAISGFWEEANGDIGAKPGSWAHFTAVAAPWITFWCRMGAA